MKKYFLKIKFQIVIQLLFTVLYSIAVALIPALNKYLFDHIMDGGFRLLLLLVGGYVLLIVSNGIFQYISRYYEWKVSEKFNLTIKRDLFIHIASMNNQKFNQKKVSDYVTVFNNDIEVIGEDYISAYIDLIKSILNMLVFALAVLYFVNLETALVVFSTSIIAVLIPKLMQTRLSNARKNQLTALSKYFGKILDLLSGKKRINSFTIRSFTKEHQSSLDECEKKRLFFGKIKTQSDMLNALGVFFVELCTFSLVGYLLVKKEITIGMGIATFGYVTTFLNPIRNVLDCLNCIHSSQETVDQVLSYLTVEPIHHEEDFSASVDTLRIENLSCKVGQFELTPLSYTFKNGYTYGIIGHSGSGKSTLLKLLEGSIEGSGKIYINDLETMSLDVCMFSLDQFEYLFETSFLNNITVFDSYDHHSLADQLLSRLHTVTQEKLQDYKKVNQLSGGEKQIVSILRMLVADKSIILLDESFANIDKKNTDLIKDFLYQLEHKIIIEVTHDLSEENILRYDHIIHLDDGELIVNQINAQ